jgi:hypothetical protein
MSCVGDVADDAYAHPQTVAGQVAQRNILLLDDRERRLGGAGADGAFGGDGAGPLQRLFALQALKDLSTSPETWAMAAPTALATP